MSSVVLVAGGYRTGTTVAYMIAQRLLAAAGQDHEALGVDASTIAVALRMEEAWLVLKGHDVALPEGPGQRVIWCDRDAVDAIASYSRFVSLPEAVDAWRRTLKLRRFYEADRHDVLWLNYEWLYRRPRHRVDLIAEHLGLAVRPELRVAIASDLSAERVKQIADGLAEADSWSELRPGHVGANLGRPRSTSPELRSRIEAALGAEP